jgi:ribosomal protein S18 acetylase RimI-like enzyme
LVNLLQLVFGDSLDGEDRHYLNEIAGHSAYVPPMLWRFNPSAARLSPGFVWEDTGRVVGNITLLPTRVYGRFLVANVAVHPDYRRRGIARQLMIATQEAVRARNGRVILLQVVKENEPAIHLYRSLGYEIIGHMTSWYSSNSRLRRLDTAADGPSIRPLAGNQWRNAIEVDRAALLPDLNWPEPLAPEAYKLGLWERFDNFMNGRQIETWVVEGYGHELAGLAAIKTEWSKPHQLSLRVRPEWVGQLERPLLAKLLRRLAYLSRRNVRMDHHDDDLITSNLLREANFIPKRTLTYMRLVLTRS